MFAVYHLIDTLVTIAIWVLIISVVLSWLIAFDIVNPRQRVVYMINDTVSRLTEPMLRPIRNTLPPMGGIDISPMVLILGLIFVRNLAFEYLRP